MAAPSFPRLLSVVLVPLSLCLIVGSPALADDKGITTSAVEDDTTYPRNTLPNSAGGELSLGEARGRVATVLVSLSIECPISNEYLPTINRLAETYKPKGVNFFGINPSAGQTLEQMAEHAKEYKFTFPFLQDPGAKVSRRLMFQVTPEVCVYDASEKLVYRGRIDDRYRVRGGASGVIANHDLAKALDETIEGKPVTTARTKAVGCPLQFDAPQQTSQAPGAAGGVTYSHQIARIVQTHCQECHRAGGMGPFALSSYEQAVRWADDLKTFTANGRMPPWKPVAGHGEFKNVRSLSDDEKNAIAQWVAGGCPEGDRGQLPPERSFTDSWRLGTPDVVLQPSEPYTLGADGRDEFRNFLLPLELDSDKFIAGVEVLPGNPRVVHHVVLFLDDSGAAEQLDARDPLPGYGSTQGYPGFFAAGGLGGWAPGNLPGRLPDGVARILPQNAKIVMQVHYHRTGKEEVDQTRIGLHYARGKVTRQVLPLIVLPFDQMVRRMRIPAGSSNYRVSGSFIMPVGGLAMSVIPHMHMLGKDIRLTATFPDGRRQPLLFVDDWDFWWQEMYYYQEMIDLPAGTRIDLVAHFDNSSANLDNPSTPPRDVRWGEQTTDEMCLAFLEMISYEEAANEGELKLPDRAAGLRMVLEGHTAAARQDAPPAKPREPGPLERATSSLWRVLSGKARE